MPLSDAARARIKILASGETRQPSTRPKAESAARKRTPAAASQADTGVQPEEVLAPPAAEPPGFETQPEEVVVPEEPIPEQQPPTFAEQEQLEGSEALQSAFAARPTPRTPTAEEQRLADPVGIKAGARAVGGAVASGARSLYDALQEWREDHLKRHPDPRALRSSTSSRIY